MKTDIPQSPPEPVTPQASPAENLIQLLADKRTQRYLGRSCGLRLETLAALLSGSRTLNSIAREYGTSRQVHFTVGPRSPDGLRVVTPIRLTLATG